MLGLVLGLKEWFSLPPASKRLETLFRSQDIQAKQIFRKKFNDIDASWVA
jgi:hypothetical protein